MLIWEGRGIQYDAHMKLACAVFALVLAISGHSARADTHCYEFRNDSSKVVNLTFSYQPAIGNVTTGAAIEPGKTYPFDGRPWCWNLPEEVTATVIVSAPAVARWKGSLVLGNRAGTAPSGTYAVGPAGTAGAPAAAAPAAAAATAGAATALTGAPGAPAAAAAKGAPAGCLANTFPNGDAYCLTALDRDVQVECGTGHTGISGSIVVNHLGVQCRNGKKLKLTCGTTTGGRQKCDLNDHEICTDDHIRSAADYCSY